MYMLYRHYPSSSDSSARNYWGRLRLGSCCHTEKFRCEKNTDDARSSFAVEGRRTMTGLGDGARTCDVCV